jgi:hypothetical protein
MVKANCHYCLFILLFLKKQMMEDETPEGFSWEDYEYTRFCPNCQTDIFQMLLDLLDEMMDDNPSVLPKPVQND